MAVPTVATPAEPLCVISPHLDDAALSCGRLLAAASEAVVFTAFGGTPPDDGGPTHEWDQTTTDSDTAGPAVATRQEEDLLAMTRLGCRARWSEWSEYHRPEPTVDDLARAVAAALSDLRPASVLMPLGVYHHHHVAVSEAALAVLTGEAGTTADGADWYVYAETPYTQHYPAETATRLERLRAVVGLTEVSLPQAPAARRVAAVDAYATQLPLLRALLPHIDDDLRDVEPYWRVTPPLLP